MRSDLYTTIFMLRGDKFLLHEANYLDSFDKCTESNVILSQKTNVEPRGTIFLRFYLITFTKYRNV